MKRKINFNGGPAAIPSEVLQQASAAVLEYGDTGISALELPHRGRDFKAIIAESNALVKELCGLGDDYEVIWLQGGGRMQFCMLPMNFLDSSKSAGYIDSGFWAREAAEYGKYYGDARVLSSSKDVNYSRLPSWPADIPSSLAYLHFTTNNTIYGTQWHEVPAAPVPLVADMSSDIFSAVHDYTRYAMFYAAVQKNLGTPGLALVVVHKDFLAKATPALPAMLSYQRHAQENSILNTANVFGNYVSLLMLRWTKARGIAAIDKENRQKAALLYQAIDDSNLFHAHVSEKAHRSLMNVCFTAKDANTEKAFISLCEQNNLIGIQGHRSVGGFRVSLYNAVTLDDVNCLVKLMKEFENG